MKNRVRRTFSFIKSSRESRGLVMKSIPVLRIAIIFIAFISLAACGGGDTAALLSGVYIQDGSADLVSGSFSVPVIYDWNSDGKKDILVGHKDINSNGYINYYENNGTDSSPSFNGSTHIMSCNAECSPVNVPGSG